MQLLRNILFYLIFYPGSAVLSASAALTAPINRRVFLACVHAWSGLQRWCVENILGCPVIIEGQKHDGPALYAVKHESFFEAIDAPTLFDMPAVLAKSELFRIPAWGRAARAYGLIEVDRTAGARALIGMMRQAREAAEAGRPLVIFPEGTRVPHGEERKLAAGFAGLYKALGLPVVPVAVDSGPTYKPGLKPRRPITYRFGEAIPPGLPRGEAEARVIAAINALNR
ncbi:lysophospholipid acyltransferase family protein [Qipengyuania sp.]|uniref:lysophospholipid acyltransferase family protein n=1 Tax=Qipengyuania sp. TaxID=2004515 RepID=UPI0035C86E14